MEQLITVMLALLIGHTLADFVLQRNGLIVAKRARRPWAYIEHVSIIWPLAVRYNKTSARAKGNRQG